MLDAAGADAPHGVAVGGECIVVADLVAQLAGHPFGHAVAVAVDQPHRLVVDLMLVVLEPACTHINVQVGAGREAVLHQRNLGPHVEKVGGFVVVPATVGQKTAVVVHRHATQAVAAQVLGDVGELQGQLAGVAHVEGQRCIADHAFAVRVPAHALFGVAIQPGAVAHAARGVQRPGGLDRRSPEIVVAGLQFDAALGGGFGLARHVVDDASCIAAAIQGTGGSLQDFHALDVEQLRHRKAGIGVAAQAVIQHVFLAEAAQGHAGIAEETDAADAAVQVGDLAGRLVFNQLTRHHLDGLRHQRQRRVRTRAHRGVVHPVEGLGASEHLHCVELLHIGGGGRSGVGRKAGQGQGQAQGRGAKRRAGHRGRGGGVGANEKD